MLKFKTLMIHLKYQNIVILDALFGDSNVIFKINNLITKNPTLIIQKIEFREIS